MNTASLELCKELHKLSGWKTDDHYIRIKDPEAPIELWSDYDEKPADIDYEVVSPAYDLGYLLRKLPRHLDIKRITYHLCIINGNRNDDNWVVDYVSIGRVCWLHEGGKAQLTEADTPEDAATKLAIELFKQGVLTKREV